MERILVIDDEPSALNTMKEILEFEKYIVDTTHNALSGLRKINDQKYNLILLDIKMPGMNGIEALRLIQNRHPSIPVIMCSGIHKLDTVIEAVKIGAFDYITKPWDINKVLITVRNAIDKSNLLEDVSELLEKRNSDREIRNLKIEIEPIYQKTISKYLELLKLYLIKKGISNNEIIVDEKEKLIELKFSNFDNLKHINDFYEIILNKVINIKNYNTKDKELETNSEIIEELQNKNKVLEHYNDLARSKNQLLIEQNEFLKEVTLNLTGKIPKMKSYFNISLTSDQYKLKLKSKIGEGKIVNVLEELLSLVITQNNVELFNQLIMLQSKVRLLESESISNTISKQEKKLGRNQIEDSILKIIDIIKYSP